MAVGKNIFFIANGIRLHDALKSFQPSMTKDELDATTLGTTGAFREFVGSFKSGQLDLEGIWDSDTVNLDEIHDVLMAAFNNDADVQLLASFEAIVNGQTALMLYNGQVLDYGIPADTGALIMAQAKLRADNAIEGGKWHYNNNATGASNGTSVDNGAATTNGGHYQGHLYLESDSAALNASFTLQHSTDNSVWVDVEAAQSVGANAGAVSRVVTGTINRYTRIVFTPTGGKGYAVGAFARRY